jgi:iduronate 2-sulfatase
MELFVRSAQQEHHRFRVFRVFRGSFLLIPIPNVILLHPFSRFAALLCVVATHAFTAPAARQNVLLICVDDLKPLLGCYGDTRVKSPNIDRLAASGMVFESAYCNQAVCAPSRNALMTGLRSTTLGIYDLPTNFRVAAPEALTVAQHFKHNGYRTESLGKIMHSGHGNREDEASWSVPHWRPAGGAYARAANNSARGPEGEKAANAPATIANPAVENADVPDHAYADGIIADEAVRRLRAAKEKPDTPFFLAVGFLKPHLPFCAPKKYWDLYRRDAFSVAKITTAPVGAPAYAPTTWGELRNYTGIPATGPLSEDLQRELIHGYHAAISYMDAQLGKVLEELERLGLHDKTTIVFWGDHGWHLGDHGQWCKHTNYEQGTRIPFIVRSPGLTKPGSHSKALVESVDVFPTLTEIAGLPAAKSSHALDGRSFVATLRNPAAPTKEAVFHAYPRSRPGDGVIIGRAVRTNRYRLVEWKKPGAAPDTADLELYDYEADPLETKNLAAEQPQVVADLRKLLAAQPEARPQVKGPDAAPAKNKKKAAAQKS